MIIITFLIDYHHNYSPFMRWYPLVEGGQKLVQPVFVADVSKALLGIVRASSELEGRDVNLVGPAEYTYKELVEYILDLTKKNTPYVSSLISLFKLFFIIAYSR